MPSITIRDVPAEVRDELAVRAARSGRSLQEYLSAELAELASRPDVAEIVVRARRRARAAGRHLSAEEILADRDADRR
jgi:antitoxin FitA